MFVTLYTDKSQVTLTYDIGERPQIIYWGKRLRNTPENQLAHLGQRQYARGAAYEDIQPSLSNELGAGIYGSTGLLAHRAGKDWATSLEVTDVRQHSEQSLTINCYDPRAKIEAVYNIEIDIDTHVIVATTRLKNIGNSPLYLDWCTALSMPLDNRFTRLKSYMGRWSDEFRTQDIPNFRGGYIRENKIGRTGHDGVPALLALADGTTECCGDAVGFHLGWSGNNRVRVDRTIDARSFVHMGEYFFPGEIIIDPGQTYQSPPLYAAWSEQGLNGVSQSFHHHVMHSVLDGRIKDKARPVHYNTWEAVYFDITEDKLISLAEAAAEVGAERFVLDDGWFGGRRCQEKGLGDWYVSEEVLPNGLQPLVDKVRSLGMEFGIWFEPEMVNPDSELYRNHPDWILNAPGVEQVPFRYQVALDLTKPEVVEYLFECMSAVIGKYQVDYVKWDMNRDIHHPGSDGHAATHKQTLALYALMRRLRETYPNLEIESCASGGARADYGVLANTDRIWTSDSNDALDRQTIQRGASYFFPLPIMGAHVGPRNCHITGRELTMDFRAGTAIFGHMGIEADLSKESEEDRHILGNAVDLYKQHRELLHSGKFYRLDTVSYLNAVGVVSNTGNEALFSCAMVDGHPDILPVRLQLTGLLPERQFRLRLVWPKNPNSITQPSPLDHNDLLGEGRVFSGEALMNYGIQLPLMFPLTCLIYHLKEEI